MSREKVSEFKNIVLQESDGTLRTFENGAKGQHIILLVLEEHPPDMAKVTIRSVYTAMAAGAMIQEFIKDNREVQEAMLHASMMDLVRNLQAMGTPEEGGPGSETLQ